MPEQAAVIELLIKLRDAMSGPLHKAEENVSKFSRALDKFEKSARHFKAVAYAGAAMEGIAWGLGEAMKHLAEPAIQFQVAQEDLMRATHLSTQQLKAFEHQATHLSDTWPRSATEITEAQANLVRTLGSASAAMQTVGIATQFATATQLDMRSATNLLATAYENVGDKSVPLQVGFARLADQLTVLQNRFSTSRENGEMMVRSFARLSGVAKVAGVGTTQLMAALGVLNKSGFAGGRGASEYLSQAIERLGQLDKDGVPQLMKYGIMLGGHLDRTGHFHLNLLQTLENMQRASPMRLQAYLKSLGQVGGTLQILLDRYSQVTDAVKALQGAQGATSSLATEMNKGWHQQLEDLHNSYQNLERSLGSVLVPLLIDVAHILEPILARFRKFAEAHTTLTKVAFVVALVGTGLLALGGFIAIATAAFGGLAATVTLATGVFEAFEGVMAAIDVLADANPLGLILIGAVALWAAATELMDHWGDVVEFFEWLGPKLAWPFVWLWDKLMGFIAPATKWGKAFIHAIVKGFESGFSFLEHGLHKVAAVIEKYLPFFHPGGALAHTHTHTQVTRTIAHAMGRAPAVAAVAGLSLAGAAPAFAGHASMPAVEIHLHMDGEAVQSVTEDDEAFADKVVDALATHKQKIAAQIGEIMGAAHGNWQSTGF
jgi:TP901 family phage tail tape measure protein